MLLEWVAPGIIQERQMRPDASMAEIRAELMKVAASESLGADHKASRWETSWTTLGGCGHGGTVSSCFISWPSRWRGKILEGDWHRPFQGGIA